MIWVWDTCNQLQVLDSKVQLKFPYRCMFICCSPQPNHFAYSTLNLEKTQNFFTHFLVFNPEQFICSQFMEYHMIDCHVTYLRMGVWFPQDGVGNQTSLLPGKKLFCETMLQYHQWHNGANKLILYIILKCQSIMGIVLS